MVRVVLTAHQTLAYITVCKLNKQRDGTQSQGNHDGLRRIQPHPVQLSHQTTCPACKTVDTELVQYSTLCFIFLPGPAQIRSKHDVACKGVHIRMHATQYTARPTTIAARRPRPTITAAGCFHTYWNLQNPTVLHQLPLIMSGLSKTVQHSITDRNPVVPINQPSMAKK